MASGVLSPRPALSWGPRPENRPHQKQTAPTEEGISLSRGAVQSFNAEPVFRECFSVGTLRRNGGPCQERYKNFLHYVVGKTKHCEPTAGLGKLGIPEKFSAFKLYRAKIFHVVRAVA